MQSGVGKVVVIVVVDGVVAAEVIGDRQGTETVNDKLKPTKNQLFISRSHRHRKSQSVGEGRTLFEYQVLKLLKNIASHRQVSGRWIAAFFVTDAKAL